MKKILVVAFGAVCALSVTGPAIAGSYSSLGGVPNASGRYGALLPATAALPNPQMTPGVVDPRVSQANLDQTICRRGGYTKSVRPPESYTEKLKREQIRQYGYADRRMRDYEEDHLISLELGGSPSDPRNLWPEPHHVAGGWGSYAKDKLENRLHRMVCHRQISLADAQRAVAGNWVASYKQLIGPVPNNKRW